MTKEDKIIKALDSRTMIEIRYSNKVRSIEPYAYGINAKGTFLLRAFQTEPEQSWKLFNVDKMDILREGVIQFPIRQGFKLGDAAMSHKLIAEIII